LSFELLLVDDGSGDSTLARMREQALWFSWILRARSWTGRAFCRTVLASPIRDAGCGFSVMTPDAAWKREKRLSPIGLAH
jgi:hypothetical protein